MSKFTDHLWRDLVREHGETLAVADQPAPDRARRPRPRLLAGGTLGLAGVGAALVIALSAGGAAAPPAFAVTRSNDGSLVVNLSYVGGQTISQVNQKLASMGADEGFSIRMGTGPAPVTGPVTCTQGPGANTPVSVIMGKDGTDVISAGQSAGNTAEGTFHVAACYLTRDSGSGNSGNTGTG